MFPDHHPGMIDLQLSYMLRVSADTSYFDPLDMCFLACTLATDHKILSTAQRVAGTIEADTKA